eukprot:12354831-Alexandrium_andersonii.AAC.1
MLPTAMSRYASRRGVLDLASLFMTLCGISKLSPRAASPRVASASRSPCPHPFFGMVRRYRGEGGEEVANVAPDDLARLGRRLAAYARSR